MSCNMQYENVVNNAGRQIRRFQLAILSRWYFHPRPQSRRVRSMVSLIHAAPGSSCCFSWTFPICDRPATRKPRTMSRCEPGDFLITVPCQTAHSCEA